ncbi:TetR family transcriptional regulator, partial [Azorhizobium doebereinerae]|uniref:TetR family transcriptional regulator n=1 Tax=Azorhizobium doebereinerae TaxID=281091 RepID=UPI0004108F31
MTSETSRDAALRAFLQLLEEMPFERIDLADVAERAGLPLSELRAECASTRDLLAAFMRATDRQVLAAGPAGEDITEEPPQERLLEVLMRRLDALEPHRAAVRSLSRSARRNPLLALKLLDLGTRSQTWMLAAAGVPSTGLAGAVRARGLAVLFARILAIWLDDEDPGLSRTMAALDRELANGGKLLGMMDDLAYIAIPGRTRRRAAATERPDAEPARADA